jgi:hypothetical protein
MKVVKATQRKDRRRVLLALAGLLLPILSAIVFQDFFRETVVVPILYVLWVVYLYVVSLPQALVWGVFLALALIAMTLAAPRATRSRQRRSFPDSVEETGRVATWVERVRLAKRSGYFQHALARRLGKLALAILAQPKRLEFDALKAQLMRGGLDGQIPQEALEYLEWGLLRRPPEASTRRAEPLRAPKALVHYLEDHLHLRSG